MRRAPLNLILLGDPDAGKATQATHLVSRYRLYDFDMGRELMRPRVRARFDYQRTKASGALTPTWIVRDILRRVIAGTAPGRGILFDGHPKMIGEAKLVEQLLRRYGRADPLVIYLGIPQAEILRRARKRGRDDDSAKALEKRKRYYRSQIRRVVGFFRKRYSFRRVSGMGTRSAVWKRINAAVQRHAAQNV